MIILRGYPASGKSTWAREKAGEGGYIIVSRDTIRAQVSGTDEKLLFDYESEAFVTKIVQAQARTALEEGWNVIVDATNLRRKQAVQWANLAHEMGAGYEVKDITTEPSVCIERDMGRTNPVGVDVVQWYAERFPISQWPEIRHDEAPKFKPYEPLVGTPEAVIFDLDGTLADMNGRDPYDASTCGQDIPREAVMAALKFVPRSVAILFVSGRSIDYFEETREWLTDHTDVIVNEGNLFMRPSGDFRKDAIVKSELFDEYIAPYYHILHIYDDRDQVVEMWRAKGLDAFQVAEGNF